MSREMTDLHPDFRPMVRFFKESVEAEADWDLLVFTTFRSPFEQAKEFAAGKSKARPWSSAHQYGLGVDVVPVYKKKAIWKVPHLEAQQASLKFLYWNWIVEKGKKAGLDWPGWRSVWLRTADPYHFQHPNFKIFGAQLLLTRIRTKQDMLVPERRMWIPPAMTAQDLSVRASWEV